MVIADSAARLAATLLAIVRNRIDLVATEVEEESLRYFSCLLMSLVALFFLGIAIVLGVFLAVLLYWETHRVGILLTLISLFGIIGLWIGLRVRRRYQAKPKLLGDTMNELSRDAQLLQPPS